MELCIEKPFLENSFLNSLLLLPALGPQGMVIVLLLCIVKSNAALSIVYVRHLL